MLESTLSKISLLQASVDIFALTMTYMAGVSQQTGSALRQLRNQLGVGEVSQAPWFQMRSWAPSLGCQS